MKRPLLRYLHDLEVKAESDRMRIAGIVSSTGIPMPDPTTEIRALSGKLRDALLVVDDLAEIWSSVGCPGSDDLGERIGALREIEVLR